MNYRVFIAAQFFLLSIAFQVYDPIGISYFLLGMVWVFNHRLAYVQTVVILVLKGNYGLFFALVPLTASFIPNIALKPFFVSYVLPLEIPFAFVYGAILGTQTVGKLIKRQIRKHAPDLYEMIA